MLFLNFHPNLPLALKIYGEKINNNKNLLFALKHGVHSRVYEVKKSKMEEKWFVESDKRKTKKKNTSLKIYNFSSFCE